MSDYEIYGLEDPTTNKVRYVGLSKDTQKRFKQHTSKKPMLWVRELLDQGLMPVLRILESNIPDLETAREREQHWINFYERNDCQLENVVGNESAIRWRAEQKELHQRLYTTYAYNLPPDEAQKLIRMMLAGHEIAGLCEWENTYTTVIRTINLLMKKPEFGLHLNEIDAAKMTFEIFGYTWKDGSEEEHE